ncbi:hypothetical protein WM42_1509 [Corynebacterium simulans]|nr:hypothetical protein WM42_1509 [Corynebacterium simulans]
MGYTPLITISSPRTRRYFPDSRREHHHEVLFSAHAEVFPWV